MNRKVDVLETTVSMTAFCPTVETANRAFDAILASGVPPETVSILARGVDVDRRLIEDAEMNANQLASVDADPLLTSALARRLSRDRRLLLEGAWALGPAFQELAAWSGRQGLHVRLEALLAAGLSREEASLVDSVLESHGGVWLGVSGNEEHLEVLSKTLRAIDGVEVREKVG